MPRIAYISSTFPDYQKCGVGIYAGYLTQALAQQGHDVHVVTTAIPEIRPTFGKVTVHKIMETWNPGDMPRLIQLFHQIRPEILHINHPTSIAGQKSKILVNMLPEINRHLWKIPSVTTLHEFGNVSVLGKIKLAPMILFSDAVTVTNQRYRQNILKFLPEGQKDRVQVINIGSQFDEGLKFGDRVEQRAQWGLSPTDKVLGFVGFMTPPKGFHHLIETFAPVLREDKQIKILALSSWNLSTAHYRQKILDMIEKAGISSQVIFTGFLEDKDLFQGLSAIDVCVFPFEYPVEERSSGPLRQVLFHGCPTVVFAENTSYDEFGFKHGENIWFSPHKDFEKLRAEVLNLLHNEPLRHHLSEGTKGLKPAFSFDTVSNEMSRLYAKLLSSKSLGAR